MDEKEQVAQAKMVSSPTSEPTKIVMKKKAQKDPTCGAVVVCEPFIIMIIVILVILLFFYVFGHITR